MATDHIRYDVLARDALRGVLRRVLTDAAERQSDLETIRRHREIPELVLQDDGHFLRILRKQSGRYLYALRPGEERDVEMMVPWQAVFGGVRQHLPQHAAQRVAREDVISDVICGHR